LNISLFLVLSPVSTGRDLKVFEDIDVWMLPEAGRCSRVAGHAGRLWALGFTLSWGSAPASDHIVFA
jgi:hypothetical protein